MRTAVGAVVFMVASALAFTVAFGENPLSRLFPQTTPFTSTSTTVTTSALPAEEALQMASPTSALEMATGSALSYADAPCPLGGH